MENSKQIQKAGENSQQVQIANATFVCGVDEKRVREVCSEVAVEAVKSCTAEATATALARIENFTTTLIPRVERIEKDFQSFSDPSFQFLLQSAQKTAACTDREMDYAMLSELLVHRIEKGSERKIKASISKAIEIVDQVDDDALCGLTVAFALQKWGAITGDISQGLQVLDNLFDSLCYRELPDGFNWVYHLDILDAVRASSMGSFNKFEKFYPNAYEGYTCVGIQRDSENYQKAMGILTDAKLPENLLVEHELLPNFFRLNVRDKESISSIMVPRSDLDGYLIVSSRAEEQEIDALNQVWSLYSQDIELKKQVKNAFIERWDEYSSLRTVRTWWDAIPHHFVITPIGEVLAHANAQIYNKLVPAMNEI